MRRMLTTLLLLAFFASCSTAPTVQAPPGNATPVPRPSVQPTLMAPTPTTVQQRPTAAPTASPTPARPRVGVQVGHWKLDELPAELERFKLFTGTYWEGYDEWEVNIVIAEALKLQLEAAGVEVDLIPATVPIGYRADAFVSIHADGVAGAQARTRRGYKVATPFRASPAAEALAAAVEKSYAEVTGMRFDPEGVSFNMRGHYIFSPHRFWHAVAPTTPAIMVECGFMTHPQDRQLLLEKPDLLAQGIAEGVLAYLAARDPLDRSAIEPRFIPTLRPASDGTMLYEQPDENALVEVTLDTSARLFPYTRINGWYLVQTRGDWEVGWVREEDVYATDDPQVPLWARPTSNGQDTSTP
jgi:hypothetical protein